MFGLTFEKLLVVGIIAAFVVGPQRLPAAAAALARLTRGVREMADQGRQRLRDEVGEELDEFDWQKMDPRQYDPRRIITDALRNIDPDVDEEEGPGSGSTMDVRDGRPPVSK